MRFDGTTGLFLDVFTEDPGHPLIYRPLDIEFRKVVPEPSTLIVWSLLGILGIGYGWRRRA